MLIPSAFESEEVQEAQARLKLCGMFPRGRSLRKPTLLIGALLDGKSSADLYERVKATTKTGNWVQLSSSCDIIRLLNPREMAIALNLPANYVSDLNCTDSKARTILGSAFGVKSIAHVLACLAGIGEA